MIRYGQIIPRVDNWSTSEPVQLEDVGSFISNSIADPKLQDDLNHRLRSYVIDPPLEDDNDAFGKRKSERKFYNNLHTQLEHNFEIDSKLR